MNAFVALRSIAYIKAWLRYGLNYTWSLVQTSKTYQSISTVEQQKTSNNDKLILVKTRKLELG